MPTNRAEWTKEYNKRFKSPYKKKVPATYTNRECLKCGKIFKSEGIYNRICEQCNKLRGSVSWEAEGVAEW